MATLDSEVIDLVVEWIGRKYTKGQIKAKLLRMHPHLTPRVMEPIITLARKKIRMLYNVDPVEFKGSSIEFYQSVIRSEKAELRHKILCQERLDKLLGLEHLAADDPEVYAERVRAAMQEADCSVTGEETSQEAVAEKHADIFCEISIDDLDPVLREAAVALNESD
jgi:hypothetical protein